MSEIQVQRRRERAKAGGYTVKALDEQPVFTRYAVQSPSGRTYEVTIRSLVEPANSCTCPDFLTNLVGTCKHVEAVLLQLEEHPNLGAVAPDRPQVYLHPGETLDVRLLWPSVLPPADLQSLLARYFRGDGTFRGDLAREFEGFRDAADRSAAVDIAPEVLGLVEDRREAALFEAERAAWTERLARGERLGLTSVPLRPYQERGALHLAYGRRAWLADETGLGKTAQAIAACELLRREGHVRRAVVLCPASSLAHWEREVFRFAGQQPSVVDMMARPAVSPYERAAAYTLVPHEAVVPDLDALRVLAPDLVILDEAQRLRGWRSQTADAIKRLHVRFAFVLTDTNLDDRLDDLYSVVQFLDQRLLGPLWRFNQRYYVLQDGKTVVGYKNQDELAERLSAVRLRRRIDELGESLPARLIISRHVDLDPPERSVYDSARVAVNALVARSPSGQLNASVKDRIVRQLARMRMACDAPQLVGLRPEPMALAERTGSPKLRELDRVLDDLLAQPTGRVVIASEWEKMLALVARRLKAKGLGHETLSGRMPTGRRRALASRFATDPALRVLLITDVADEDLDLSAAQTLVNLDVPWNPARREARIRRLEAGRRGPVVVVDLVARRTVEEAIRVLHERARPLHSPQPAHDRALTHMPLPTQDGLVDVAMLGALAQEEPVHAALAEVPLPEAEQVLAEFSRRLGGLPSMGALSSVQADLKALVTPPGSSPGMATLPAAIQTRIAPSAQNWASSTVQVPSHSSRHVATLPGDPLERLARLRQILSEALPDAFRDVVPLGAGFVLVVARLDARLQVQAGGIASRTGVPLLVVDADGLRSLQQMVLPLLAATGSGPAPDQVAFRARQIGQRARTRLEEARCLLSGGIGPGSLVVATECMDLCVESLTLATTGEHPPPSELVGALYGTLVPAGTVPLDLAAGVSRARDLARVAGGRGRDLVDVTVARAVMHDAQRLLELVEARMA